MSGRDNVQYRRWWYALGLAAAIVGLAAAYADVPATRAICPQDLSRLACAGFLLLASSLR